MHSSRTTCQSARPCHMMPARRALCRRPLEEVGLQCPAARVMGASFTLIRLETRQMKLHVTASAITILLASSLAAQDLTGIGCPSLCVGQESASPAPNWPSGPPQAPWIGSRRSPIGKHEAGWVGRMALLCAPAHHPLRAPVAARSKSPRYSEIETQGNVPSHHAPPT